MGPRRQRRSSEVIRGYSRTNGADAVRIDGRARLAIHTTMDATDETDERPPRTWKFWVHASVITAVVLAVGAIAVSSLGDVRTASQFKVCANHMRQVNPELERMRKATGSAPASLAKLFPDSKAVPRCPSGGDYSIVVHKDEGAVLRCTVHGDFGAGLRNAGH
jgi:hypothetical protein